jgi:hypothetical protein
MDEKTNDETARFRQDLGDLDYLADGLAPAVKGLVERVVTEATAPIKAQAEHLSLRAAREETAGVMKAFGEQHPDWKDHEAAMFDLSQKLQPTGMSSPEYLETLYGLATRGERQARERETKGAEASRAASSRPEGRTPTFREAFQAAKRGERWD